MFQHAIARRTLSVLAIGLAATGAHAQLLGGLGGGAGGALGGSLGGGLAGSTSIPVITQPRTIDATRGAIGGVTQAARQDAATLGQASPSVGLTGSAGASAGGNASGNAGTSDAGPGLGGLNAGADGGNAGTVAGGNTRGGNASSEPSPRQTTR